MRRLGDVAYPKYVIAMKPHAVQTSGLRPYLSDRWPLGIATTAAASWPIMARSEVQYVGSSTRCTSRSMKSTNACSETPM